MVIDLIAGTESGICVVFDPAAVGHLHSVEWDPFWERGGDTEAEAGNLVLLETPGDGDYKMRAYVGEAAPAELVRRAFHEEHGGLLRVPSGTLCSSGMEYLPFKEASPAGKVGTTAQVPPGDYSVDAYLIEPNENDERMTRADELTKWGCLPTLVLLPLDLWFLGINDWRFEPLTALLSLALALFWIPTLVFHQMPSTRAEKQRLADEFTPTLVLVMNRLADDADRAGLRGVLLRPPASKEQLGRARSEAASQGTAKRV